jgi:apolipoprotein N-acyltransferase
MKQYSIVSLILGVLSAFAFQPVGWWPLMPLALAGLCALVDRAPDLKRALLIGWLFGLGQFAVGLNWIATAFTYQAAMPAWLGWVAVLLLSLYLAVYPALAAGLAWRFGKGRPIALMLALAGGWAVTEWLRATMFTGFAWNPVGVVLADSPWLNVSTFVGTYGLSVLVVLAGGALWLLSHRSWKGGIVTGALIGLPLALPSPIVPDECCLRTFDVAASASLPPAAQRPPMATSRTPLPPPPQIPPAAPGSAAPPSQWPRAGDRPPPPPGPSLTAIRVVQPNIGQQDKWRPGFSDEAARRLADLSARGEFVRPRLLLWPEAAVTDPLQDDRPGNPAAFAQFERQRAAATIGPYEYLLTGGLALHSSDGRAVDGAANSIFVLGQGGKVVARYDKAHLVPYGEYLPMRPVLSAIGLSRLAPGDIDFIPGPGPRTIALPGWGKVGFQICYEIIFSGEVADRRNRPDYIYNPSNDAWFGAWGPPQHLAQARLRAAEEGLPVIRATPTGISAIVDARGRVLHSLPWRTAGVIDGGLPMKAVDPTLFARFGNIIPLAFAFLLIASAIALNARARYRRDI